MKRSTVVFLTLVAIASVTIFLFRIFETRLVLIFPLAAGCVGGWIDRKIFLKIKG